MIRQTEDWTLQTITGNTEDGYRITHHGLSSTFEYAVYEDGDLHLYSHGHGHSVAKDPHPDIVTALERDGGIV